MVPFMGFKALPYILLKNIFYFFPRAVYLRMMLVEVMVLGKCFVEELNKSTNSDLVSLTDR